MFVRYIGGRSHFEVSVNRKPYYFTKENNRTLEIKDQNVINYIFGLPNRQEFQVVEDNEKEIPSEELIEEKKEVIQSTPNKLKNIFKRKAGRPRKGD